MNRNESFARLGSWADVQRQMQIATSAGAKVVHDEDAGTVEADLTGAGDILFRAICKGGDAWIVLYSTKHYRRDDGVGTPETI